jgi:hypothetical protein
VVTQHDAQQLGTVDYFADKLIRELNASGHQLEYVGEQFGREQFRPQEERLDQRRAITEHVQAFAASGRVS